MCVPRLLAAATIRGRPLFEGGVYSKKYGIHISHEILTMDITEILSTTVLETLPLVVMELLSTEVTISPARPLSLAAPLLSYSDKLRHLII